MCLKNSYLNNDFFFLFKVIYYFQGKTGSLVAYQTFILHSYMKRAKDTESGEMDSTTGAQKASVT